MHDWFCQNELIESIWQEMDELEEISTIAWSWTHFILVFRHEPYYVGSDNIVKIRLT